MSRGYQSKVWIWRRAFAASSIAPSTRLVLHTLGMFMNEIGQSCFPSIADICRLSGLDKKTVRKHLAVAREEGWIEISNHGFRGQKWKRNEYAARLPECDLVAPNQKAERVEGGGTAPPAPDEKVGEFVTEGGGMAGPNVGELLCSPKTGPFESGVFRANIPWLGGAEDDEGIEVF